MLSDVNVLSLIRKIISFICDNIVVGMFVIWI